jgi:hypothetical protein
MAPRPSDVVLVRSVAEGLSPLASVLLEGARAVAGLTWCGELLPGMHTQRAAPVTIAEALDRVPGVPNALRRGKSQSAQGRLRAAFREIAAAGLADIGTGKAGALALHVHAEALAARRGTDLVFAELPPDLEPRTGRGWPLELLVLGSDLRRHVPNRRLARRLDVFPSTVQRVRSAARKAEQVTASRAQQVTASRAHFGPQVTASRAHITSTVQAQQAHAPLDRARPLEELREGAELRSDATRDRGFRIVRDPVTPTPAAPDRGTLEDEADRTRTTDRTIDDLEASANRDPELRELEAEAKNGPDAAATLDRYRRHAQRIDELDRDGDRPRAWLFALTVLGIHGKPWFRSKRVQMARELAVDGRVPDEAAGLVRLLSDRYGDDIGNLGALLSSSIASRMDAGHAEAKNRGLVDLVGASGIVHTPTPAEAAMLTATRTTAATVAAGAAVDHRTALERIDDALRVLHQAPALERLDVLHDLEGLTRAAATSNRTNALRRAIASTFRTVARQLEERTENRDAVAQRLVALGRDRIAAHVGPEVADQLLALAA